MCLKKYKCLLMKNECISNHSALPPLVIRSWSNEQIINRTVSYDRGGFSSFLSRVSKKRNEVLKTI